MTEVVNPYTFFLSGTKSNIANIAKIATNILKITTNIQWRCLIKT